jgi:serine/threonine protein kinase
MHATLGRVCAVKFLPAEIEQQCLKLRHPNVVQIYDSGVAENRPYVVMEWLDGEPLSKILARTATLPVVPVGGLALLMGEVLDALGAAHAMGIVHGDLRAESIFVCSDGRAKVLDLGIASPCAPGEDLRAVARILRDAAGDALGNVLGEDAADMAGALVDATAGLPAMKILPMPAPPAETSPGRMRAIMMGAIAVAAIVLVVLVLRAVR